MTRVGGRRVAAAGKRATKKAGGTRVNRAQQALKDRAVLEMRAKGFTLQQIADEHFSGHRSNAHRSISRILDEYPAEAVQQLRTVENYRLDQLQSGHWLAAVTGDVDAGKFVLAVMARRAALNGLDARPDQTTGNVTVVVDSALQTGVMREPEIIVDPTPRPGE